ncbi:MAG: adenosine deaminase [Acidimicrobiaceae bacterium]|nr:adenosine deaminase [Acidimicrobiaceae bacterium]
MDFATYVQRVPKIELHCHLEGTLRPQTVVELAAKNGIELPTTDVSSIYNYSTIYEFLEIFRLVNSTLMTEEDFARAAYESLEDGVQSSNLRYREMFFNPTLHTTRGVSTGTVLDGLAAGCRAAEADFGVGCRLIADVYRQDPPAVARQMVEEVVAHPCEHLIGIGMDAAEAPDPPERFVDAYTLAGRAGLRRTAHAAEDGPAANIATCLDLLGCERIDHGYHILEDPALVARCRDTGIFFTCCPVSTSVVYGWPDMATHPITEMVAAGLQVMLNSDDPAMFHTDLSREYRELCTANGYGPDMVRRFVLAGVDATWLDEAEQRRLREEFVVALNALDAELDPEMRPAPLKAT